MRCQVSHTLAIATKVSNSGNLNIALAFLQLHKCSKDLIVSIPDNYPFGSTYITLTRVINAMQVMELTTVIDIVVC